MNRRFIISLAIAAVIFALDLWSKEQVLHYFLEQKQPEIAVTGFFNFVLVWNRGISFGMFASLNQPYVLLCVSLIVCGILLRWLYKTPSALVAYAIGPVIGGALGNALDRVRFTAVVDFLDFHAFGYHWPAFNIADAGIFIGVVLLLFHSMFIESKSHKEKL